MTAVSSPRRRWVGATVTQVMPAVGTTPPGTDSSRLKMPAVTANRVPSRNPSDRSSSAVGGGVSRNGPRGTSPNVASIDSTKDGHSSAVIGRSWSERSVTVAVYRSGTTIRQPVPPGLSGRRPAAGAAGAAATRSGRRATPSSPAAAPRGPASLDQDGDGQADPQLLELQRGRAGPIPGVSAARRSGPGGHAVGVQGPVAAGHRLGCLLPRIV